MLVVKAEDGKDGSPLDADGEGVGGVLAHGAGGANLHQALGDDEVAGGADRKVFSDAFDDAEEDCLPDFHARDSRLSGVDCRWRSEKRARKRSWSGKSKEKSDQGCLIGVGCERGGRKVL